MLRSWLPGVAASRRFLCFADLHVSGATLARSCDVLRRVGELAQKHKAPVVFLGDFWEHRGSVAVRQVSAVLSELQRWQDQGIKAVLIPGNHDQVSRDGRIHGLEVFSAFPNIAVATDPILMPQERVAFLPWRQAAGAQEAMVDSLGEQGADWLVFAHAEVGGARTNLGHRTAGRVRVGTLQRVAAQTYLGHFHLRQCLGSASSVWYLGSPYQQSFGERGQAFGAALVTRGVREPCWLDDSFQDMPVHHRVHYPWDEQHAMQVMRQVRRQDFVQVCAPRHCIGTDALTDALRRVPCDNVRTRVLPSAADAARTDAVASAGSGLSLQQAMRQYLATLPGEASTGRDDDGDSDNAEGEDDVLLRAGTELIRRVDPALLTRLSSDDHAGVLTHRLAQSVMPARVTIDDFAGLAGRLHVDLAAAGMVMLRGSVGSGKTSVADAVTWALFGATAPRRAASRSAGLRGDEVIHEAADQTRVHLSIVLDGDADRMLHITRSKSRGRGARLDVRASFASPLLPASAGIADAQAELERALGIDLATWRVCCYAGQGATANFVTDTDRDRKIALARIFQLDGLARVAEAAREARRRDDAACARARADLQAQQSVLASLASMDDLVQRADAHEHERQAAVDAVAGITAARQAELRQAPSIAVVEREQALVAQQLQHAKERVAASECHVCGGDVTQRYRDAIAQAVEQGEQRLRALDADLVRSRDAERVRRADALREQSNPWREQAQQLDAQRSQHEAALTAATAALADAQQQQRVHAVWERGFGVRGVPALLLRHQLQHVEDRANAALAELTDGRLVVAMDMVEDGLDLRVIDTLGDTSRPRRYEMLSGGQRRCVELAFSPFAMSDVLFARSGVSVPLLVVDELTTHLGAAEKQRACDLLRRQNRQTVVVIDHDESVRGEFDTVWQLHAGRPARIDTMS